MSQFASLIERVERLLLCHEELQRTNDLLQTQLEQALRERDALRHRVNTAVSRVDTLLQQLQERDEVLQ